MSKNADLLPDANKLDSLRDEEKRLPAQGQPGYRVRAGRSGLDPLDSNAEEGHVLGVFIQQLFTGNLRTKSPLILLIMTVTGLMGIAPLVLALITAFGGQVMAAEAWIFIVLSVIVGLALLVNVVKNVFRRG